MRRSDQAIPPTVSKLGYAEPLRGPEITWPGVMAIVTKDGQVWQGQTPDTVTGKPIPLNA